MEINLNINIKYIFKYSEELYYINKLSSFYQVYIAFWIILFSVQILTIVDTTHSSLINKHYTIFVFCNIMTYLSI